MSDVFHYAPARLCWHLHRLPALIGVRLAGPAVRELMPDVRLWMLEADTGDAEGRTDGKGRPVGV